MHCPWVGVWVAVFMGVCLCASVYGCVSVFMFKVEWLQILEQESHFEMNFYCDAYSILLRIVMYHYALCFTFMEIDSRKYQSPTLHSRVIYNHAILQHTFIKTFLSAVTLINL